MAVITAAENELVERIKDYFKDGTPLSDSSTGTSPITSYYVDNAEDISNDGIPVFSNRSEDQGRKRKRSKSEEESDAGRSSSPTKRRQET